MNLRPLEWRGDHLAMLDQRLLPRQEVELKLATYEEVARAIEDMAVRGAPAIGIAAAFGYVLGMMAGEHSEVVFERLLRTRPTAVNLAWALSRMREVAGANSVLALREALAIQQEDLALNQAIGKHGDSLVSEGDTIMTICNTGSLATAGHGTALGLIRTAHANGKKIQVISLETRPRLQGLKLTAYELLKEGIPFASIVDGAAAAIMATRKVDLVVAGADRIAANGDVANKIGTYSLAVNARFHGIPFVVAAPISTFDLTAESRADIPIEERSAQEILELDGMPIAPNGAPVINPAFDVTPASLISHYVTESGVGPGGELAPQTVAKLTGHKP